MKRKKTSLGSGCSPISFVTLPIRSLHVRAYMGTPPRANVGNPLFYRSIEALSPLVSLHSTRTVGVMRTIILREYGHKAGIQIHEFKLDTAIHRKGC